MSCDTKTHGMTSINYHIIPISHGIILVSYHICIISMSLDVLLVQYYTCVPYQYNVATSKGCLPATPACTVKVADAASFIDI